MKHPALALVTVICICGCATYHSAPTAEEIRHKQDELKVLCEELRQAALQLEHVQRDLSTNGVYSVTDRARDLDYSIFAVHQARDRLVARYWKLVRKYNYDWKGPL